MWTMKTIRQIGFVALLLAVCACGGRQKAATMEGLYTYGHSFNYDLDGNHFEVSETGTMDFYADGTALDSARQVYTSTLANGDTATWVYNYISPSRWRLEGDTLHFAGTQEGFRMEVTEGTPTELAQRIADLYRGGIDYEYHFHLDTLTADRLQWSFTYRDGHSDTWAFIKVEN